MKQLRDQVPNCAGAVEVSAATNAQSVLMLFESVGRECVKQGLYTEE